MAGIGIQLNRIFDRRTVLSALHGILFSVTTTIAPMLVVIGNLLLMFRVLGFDHAGDMERELFSCTILYVFVFSLLTSSPFNSVLSKYMTDCIYAEKYEDVRPCIFLGTTINMVFSATIAVPFYLHEFFIGGDDAWYVFLSFLCYLALTFVFSSMLYNSVLKAYKKIALFFFLGMFTAFCLSVLMVYHVGIAIGPAMLLALTIGFFLIGVCELCNALRYFRSNSYSYKPPLLYFTRYWKLVVANFCYTLGLFLHNLVFWFHPWHIIIVNTYLYNQSYDMATCIAMFTNISASTFFISRVEMKFHDSYSDYMESVIGGRYSTIEKNKGRMFTSLSDQLISLVRLQFGISIVLFLVCMLLLPEVGISGLTMQIYPLLAAAYFMEFLYYSELLFLYYFNDLTGAAVGSVLFCVTSGVGSWFSMRLPIAWFGAGFAVASLVAFTYCYFRLRWIEKNLDAFIFCRGSILEHGIGRMPPARVYHKP